MKWIRELLVIFLSIVSIAVGAQCSFTNPVMEGADPFVFHHDDYYYMLVTRGDKVGIKRSKDLHKIHEYNEIVAWRFQNTPVGGHIWAPEMYLIDGKWYIYTCGQNTGLSSNPVSVPYIQENQQMVLLESQSDDPFGPYKFKTWLLEGTGAIDETIFTHTNGKRYIIWSQFNNPGQPQTQCLYIAELLNAWTIGTERIKISCPGQAWELNGWPVNEGAAVLQRNGKTYVVYSGSGYTTPEYALGYLVNTDGNLLNPDSWKKVGPLFKQNPSGGIYSTGHNSFTKSPDGSEDWIVYHGRLSPDGNTSRYVFLQKFYWKGDEPFFGVPAPVNTPVICPSTSRGQIVSISPYNNDSNVIISEAETGNLSLWLIDPNAYDIFYEQARFMSVPGMNDDNGISLESYGQQGNYLTIKGDSVIQRTYDGTEAFRSTATFFERESWVNESSGLSLEVFEQPGYYMCNIDGYIIIQAVEDRSTNEIKESATWVLSDAYTVFDCNGDFRGQAFIDSCGYCAGGMTGREPSFDKYDCPVSSGSRPLVDDLKWYPNPVKRYLYFDISPDKMESPIKIVDILGRLQMSQEITENHLDVEGLSAGVYFLSFWHERLYRTICFIRSEE